MNKELLEHQKIGLPKYFVVKKDESDPLWGLYCDWMFNIYSDDYKRKTRYYVGYDGSDIYNGMDAHDTIDGFENNPTLITLAERDRCVNKKEDTQDTSDHLLDVMRYSLSEQLSIHNKAKLYDSIMSWIDVSVLWGNSKEDVTNGLKSILEYTLGVYCSSQMKPEDIIIDRDTDTPDGEYESETRGMLACIDKDSWMYGYKAAKDILSPNK